MFLSQNYVSHNDSSTTCLSGKPQGLLATIFWRGPDCMGYAKTHPWPLPQGHENRQLRELRHCRHQGRLLLLK